ncbi:MAG: biofilm PGA synthesis N-glycosyltransferase PgaC [Bacteroidetes bacterium]|nr:MAG: biofilm PGA synthesis N-glycosyltransferase PgaC [Bacteroidota bacterium]
MHFLDDFYAYVTSIDLWKFVRIFWFFVFFEFLRFFVLDFLTVSLWWLTRRFRKDRTRRARQELFEQQPLISIIVPGKNEGQHIFRLALSLKEQTYTNYELIIIDDGSDDQTPAICASLKRNGFINLYLRNDVRGGKASAANLGLRYARGKFVVHLDADCSYDRDALENIIIPFFYDIRVGAVGGNVTVRNYKHSLCATLQAVEYFDTISVGRIATSELGIYRVISGAFGAFRREALTRVGGWDIGPGLDGDITVKVRKLGYKIRFEPNAICKTSVPVTFRKLIRQRLRWDKSLIRFRLRKHRDVFYPNETFRWSNFISFVEITYNLVLNIKWYVYIADMVVNFASYIPFILMTNILLYTCSNVVKYLMFSLFRTKRNEPIGYFLPYLPVMVIYFGYYLRIIRSVAYIQELLFKASYKDPWNPQKTSRHAKALKI